MSELKDLKDQITALDKKLEDRASSLDKKMDRNTTITTTGFDKMNGRVKKLELDKARRDGIASVMRPGDGLDWKKLSLSLAKSLGIGLSIAYLLAQAFLK